ncbi:alpha/beta fold hydrolase [Streptomyces albipurpureus]|uniref:Alpha/beta hydrolase n=1 Tax=Streptomyces albipurpureus TaxID=2897419 RepID=A0ABT0V0S5_9ACTN|nr:alpha/beta fold hydrolase [Streptomyces sp. CWNU-1]MCM2393774.1 alpha/beta hydrolase [Streptomyces sp. CWNU-1]
MTAPPRPVHPRQEPLPLVLVPGMLCSPRLFAEQLPQLWRHGPVMVADIRHDDSLPALARRLLGTAPPRFALAGLSMGGYVAFEVMRQAGHRVSRLALLDTTARPDTPQKREGRRGHAELARAGRLGELSDLLFPRYFHDPEADDGARRALVRLMAEETGADAYLRQLGAVADRPDSRSGLAAIHCPTLVLVGASDGVTPPDRAAEIANGIPGARLVTVPECGHLSTLDRPREVTRALVSWARDRE